MDELIQFIHQEEITKEYLKQNQGKANRKKLIETK